MKIYTKAGDAGRTGLFAGGTCSKNDLRIEAIGAVDELNSQLGKAVTLLGGTPLRQAVETVQGWLFEAGAELASRDPVAAGMAVLGDAEIEQLERWIDAMTAELPPLKTFILPGGAPAGAELHVARTMCRRAERRVVALSEQDHSAIRGELLRFFNRMSDWLFVCARIQNQHDGVIEKAWLPRT